MAYPDVVAAYGLKPVKRLDGMPYAGAVRHMPIASGYATGIGFGEPVKRLADGTIATAAAGDKAIGVFVGCQYTDPTSKQMTFNQQWPAGTASPDAKALVVDDPNAIFKTVVLTDVSGTVGGVLPKAVGGNASMFDLGAPNTATGNSTAGLKASTVATGASLAMRIVDGVEETAYVDGGNKKYREVLVMFNLHQYREVTGVYA